MPWRSRPTPYRVWVSEIMLQQTQVDTVRPYFTRFVKQFPSIRRLAAADLQDVLKAWEGLGYYTRARNLQRAAQLVIERHGGRLPRSAEALQTLPGIGAYTAAAIASIAFGEPVPAIDGNVIRVVTRLLGITADSRAPRTLRRIRDMLDARLPPRRAGDFNQALMELGALVCRPRTPDCPHCPLRRDCRARAAGRQDRIPVRRPRRTPPHYHVAACVIRKRGRVLIAQRKEGEMLAGLWEFPGGKQEPGEPLEQTAVREIGEELDIRIAVVDKLMTVKHAYSHFRITLHVFDCRHQGGRVRCLDCAAARWVPVSRLGDYPFSAADVAIVRQLQDRPASGK